MDKSPNPEQLSPISRRVFFRQVAINAAKLGVAAVAVTSLVKGCVYAPAGPAVPGCYCDFAGQDYSSVCGAYCDYFNYADIG